MEKSLCLLLLTTINSLILVESADGSNRHRQHCGDYYIEIEVPSFETVPVSVAFIERCIEIENIFEDALLQNKINLHILQKTFISSSHPSPNLLNVIYQIDNIENVEAVWSSSHVFTVIDPKTLHDLQSGIMTAVFGLEGIILPETIVLYLNLSNHKFTWEEEVYGIITVTEKLKAYAVHQDRLSNWNGQDKGYVILSTLPQAISSAVLIPLATLVIVFVGIASSWKLVRRLSALDEGYETDVKISLFWSFVVVIIFTNIHDIAISIMFTKLTPSNSHRKPYVVIKFIVAIFIAILGAVLGWRSSERNLPRNHRTSSDPFCCSVTHMKRIDYSCAVCNIFLFAYIIGISVISTTALAVVHPVLVLSTVTYIATSLFCIAALLAIPRSFGLIVNRLTTHQNQNEFKKQCLFLCDGVLYTFAMIAFCLINLLYLLIQSNEDSTYSSGILSSTSSFLPSIIVAMVGYFAKKKLTAKKRRKFKEQLSIDEESAYPSLECEEKIEMSSLVLVGEERVSGSHSSDNEDELAKLLPKTEETKL